MGGFGILLCLMFVRLNVVVICLLLMVWKMVMWWGLVRLLVLCVSVIVWISDSGLVVG